jgi:putative CRISPR-associated protein (TIGR02619 family)
MHEIGGEQMNRQKPNFVLSPCGTSLLTNGATSEERNLLNQHSNAKTLEDTASDGTRLERVLAAKRQTIAQAETGEVGKLSAELNALVKLYEGDLSRASHDYHVLLCTDTWLGEQAAEMVCDWLQGKGLKVEVKRQTDLQTADVVSFQAALSDIVQWCEVTLPGYQQRGYHIIFNLTGGFKSVQGFLQTLAMFYADESVYVFESAKDLLRIPRLPVQLNDEGVLAKYVNAFRRLGAKLPVPQDKTAGIPETMLMVMDGQATLSPWGEIVWQRGWKALYEERLHPAPSEKIVYGDAFQKSLAELSPNRIKEVNQKIDDLAKYLELGHHLRSLDLKELKGNPRPGSTHELDAWSDQDAKRIFCHYDEQKRLVLDSLDKALH